MSAIESWVRTPAAVGLGWALAHSVWQGAAAAMVVAATLAVTRSARARYGSACVSLAMMTIAFGWTWWISIPQAAGPLGATVIRSWRAIDASAGLPSLARQSTLGAILPWLAPVWLAGVLAFQLRALAGWTAARRLRTTGVCPAPDEWRGRLEQLKQAQANLPGR